MAVLTPEGVADLRRRVAYSATGRERTSYEDVADLLDTLRAALQHLADASMTVSTWFNWHPAPDSELGQLLAIRNAFEEEST